MTLARLSRRARAEEGFSLIELLVVVIIIGILAAIAVPAFLHQRGKAEDAAASAHVRQALSEVESCYIDTRDYARCTTDSSPSVLAGTQIPTGGAAGVTVTAPSGTNDYRITSVSRSGRTFSIVKGSDGRVTGP